MITVKAKAMVDWGIFYIPNLEKRQITEWDQPALVRLLLAVFEITVKISYPYPKLDVCFLHRITSEIIAGCASYDFESQKKSM